MKCPKCGAETMALWIQKKPEKILIPTFECPSCDTAGLLETCEDMMEWVQTMILDDTPRIIPKRDRGD